MASKLRTYLEMNDRDQLKPGKVSSRDLRLQPTTDRPSIRAVYEPIAAAHDWPDFEDWATAFEKPGRHFFLITIDGHLAGIAKFIDHGGGDVQLDNFGLLAEFIGQGHGGDALTRVIEEGWRIAGEGRLWLNTCADDHPHALHNYIARGFEFTHTAVS